MNTMKRTVMALLAALALAWAPAAYAVDNGTEFGIEDDLTVLGTAGTAIDPDAEIKGFTVFGSTQASYLIPVEAGNVVLNGEVQVSSGLYVTGSSTFTASVYLPNAGQIYVNDGTAGYVLKKNAAGYLDWAQDATGLSSLGSPYRLQMVNATSDGLVDSLFLQNAGGTSITMIAASSMTILGDGTDGLGVAGAAKFSGTVNLGDAAGDAITAVGAVTAQNGVSVTGGDLSAANNLSAGGNATLGDAVTDTHAINTLVEAGTALKVDSVGVSGNYAAKFLSGGSLAAWIKKK